MTQKETLHYETIKIQNQIRTIQGKAEENINLDTYVDTPNFKKYADRRTKVELEKELAIAQEALKEAQKEAAVKEWLTTEEGKAYVKALRDEREALINRNKELINDGRVYASAQVKKLLGDQWDVTSFCDSYMTIGIVEKYLENGRPEAIFGHTFEIYFRKDWKCVKGGFKVYYRWEMNYGTMGSFVLGGENNTRAQFLLGMGKFVSDTEIVPEMKNYLHSMAETIDKNNEARLKVEREIENPKIEG